MNHVRFPENARVEFLFSQGAEKVRADHLSVSFAQPVETTENLERWDSYEDFNNLAQDPSSLEENGIPVSGRVRVMHVQHTEGPLDGSLYATVTKSREELRQEQLQQQRHPHLFSSSNTTTSSTRSQHYHHSESSNKHSERSFSDVSYGQPSLLSKQSPHALTNGPLDQSADSGISSPLSGYTGSGQPQHQQHHATQNNNNNMASTMMSSQQSHNTMALRNNQNLDDHSQLDDILSELLGEQALNERTGTLTQKGQQVSPTSGSLTTQSGNSRTVVSWQTSNAGPSKSSTVSKHTVSKPTPNAHAESFQTVHKEEFAYSSDLPQKSSSTMLNSSPSKTMPKLPPNAFSYGSVQESRQFQETHSSETKREGMKSPTPPPRDSSRGRVTSPIFRDRVDSPSIRNRIGSPIMGSSPPSSKVNSVPYRVDYQNQDAGRGYYSDSEHSMSWLEQQQMKLQAKREGRGHDHRNKRERQLVSELRNAQSTLQRQRAESESHERDIMDQYSKQNTDVYMANGPSYAITTSPDEGYRRPFSPGSLQRSASAVDHTDHKSEKKFYVSGVERPPFTTHQTKYTFSVSPPNKSTNGAIKNKPPPAPGQFGRSAPTSPIIPQRGTSSQSAVQQQKSKSVNREWQTQGYNNSRLDELEKSLQSALQTQPKYEENKTSESRYTESSCQQNTFRSITPEWDKKEHLAPPPEPEVEEEVVSLQPIGPGLQNLEPEGTGTLGRGARSPTPNFPFQQQAVETPPFPVSPLSPKIPYDNKAVQPGMTRSFEQSQQFEVHSYNQPPAIVQPVQPQPRVVSPLHTTEFSENRFERQEVHGQQNQPPQQSPMSFQQALQREQQQQQRMETMHQSGTLGRDNMHQSGTLGRVQSPSYTGAGTIDRGTIDRGSHDTGMSPFPDQDQTYSIETKTLERSYTMPSNNSSRGLKSSASSSMVNDGGTQTLERSYSTGNAAQFAQQQQQVPATPPFPKGPRSPMSPYENRGGALRQGSSQTNMMTQDGHSMTGQSGQQQVQYTQGTLQASGKGFQHIAPEVTAGGTQIVREYQESAQRSFTPGAPISQEEMVRMGHQQQHSAIQDQSGGYQQGSIGGFQQTGSGFQQSGSGFQQTGSDFQQSSSGFKQSGGGFQQTGSGYQQNVDGFQQANTGFQQSGGGFQQTGGGFQQGGDGFQQVGGGGYQQHSSSTASSYSQSGSGFQPAVGYQQQQSGGSQGYQAGGGGAVGSGGYSQTSYGQQGVVQNGGAQMGTLSVDTSMRSMGSSGYQRSPGSQSSDGVSPGGMHTLTSQSHTLRSQQSGGRITPGGHSMTGQSSPGYMGHSRKGSFSSLDGSSDIAHHTPRFVRDTSKLWYKPHFSRDEAINLLKDRCAGSFVVRDSNSFPGAFGLALKVAHIPPNVPTKANDPQTELVRHFLIEPTSKGVKLKGCSNEPVFASLAALVYQHSITPLALPCKLLLPELAEVGLDMTDNGPNITSGTLLAQGAACNVLFLHTSDMESLTGPEAVAKAVKEVLGLNTAGKTTVVHFKVSSQGITLTDNKRRLFFRRHYPVSAVTFCGMDPEDRKWTQNHEDTGLPMGSKIFGFVARKSGGSQENQCHLFAELDPEQPASAIVNFVTKVMIGQGRIMKT